MYAVRHGPLLGHHVLWMGSTRIKYDYCNRFGDYAISGFSSSEDCDRFMKGRNRAQTHSREAESLGLPTGTVLELVSREVLARLTSRREIPKDCPVHSMRNRIGWPCNVENLGQIGPHGHRSPCGCSGWNSIILRN